MLKTLPYHMPDIPKSFLKSPLGRSLGRHGADAQKLGLYLLANPYLDLRGHYALPLKAIMQHTEIKAKRLKTLLQWLERIDFCTYDWTAKCVTVPLVAQIYAGLGGNMPFADAPQATDLSTQERI